MASSTKLKTSVESSTNQLFDCDDIEYKESSATEREGVQAWLENVILGVFGLRDLEEKREAELAELEFTYEKKYSINAKHTNGCDLSPEWRAQWIEQWEEVRKSIPELDFCLDHPIFAQVWYWGSLALMFSFLKCDNPWYVASGILFGFTLSQMMFVFSHMIAHAEFLWIYDEPKLWIQETYQLTRGFVESKSAVKYYAFYHHHSNIKNDWYPFLNAMIPAGSLITQIIHVHTFTLLYQPGKWLWCIFIAWYSPQNIGWLAFGFNLSAFYLWMGHDWSHKKALEESMLFGSFFKVLLNLWSTLGINANADDHLIHHVHDHKYVYKSFSIGETFFPYFMDIHFDNLWERAWDKATLENGELHYSFLGNLGELGVQHRNLVVLAYLSVISIISFFYGGWDSIVFCLTEIVAFAATFFIAISAAYVFNFGYIKN